MSSKKRRLRLGSDLASGVLNRSRDRTFFDGVYRTEHVNAPAPAPIDHEKKKADRKKVRAARKSSRKLKA
jgi:hypothetical protein